MNSSGTDSSNSNSIAPHLRDRITEAWQQWQQTPCEDLLLCGELLQQTRQQMPAIARELPANVQEYIRRSDEHEWQIMTQKLSQVHQTASAEDIEPIEEQQRSLDRLCEAVCRIGDCLESLETVTPAAKQMLRQALEGARQVGSISLGTGKVEGIAISPNGEQMAVAGETGDISLIKISSIARQNSVLHQWQACQTGFVQTLTFGPLGQQLVTGCSDGTWQLWSVTGEAISQSKQSHEGAILSLGLTPDGTILATTGTDLAVQLWTLDGQPQLALAGQGGLIHQLKFDPLGRWLLGAGGDGYLYMWDIHKQRLVDRIHAQLNPPQELELDELLSVAADRSGERVLCGSWGGKLFVWDVAAEQGFSWQAHQGPVTAVGFEAAGGMVSTGWGPQLAHWDARGSLLRQMRASHADGVSAMAVAPDGTQIVCGTLAGKVWMWDLRDLNAMVKPGQESWLGWLQVACDRLQNFPDPLLSFSNKTRKAASVCERIKKLEGEQFKASE